LDPADGRRAVFVVRGFEMGLSKLAKTASTLGDGVAKSESACEVSGIESGWGAGAGGCFGVGFWSWSNPSESENGSSLAALVGESAGGPVVPGRGENRLSS
jgi:hypothetical protein